MKHMRTINGVIAAIHADDPNSALTPHWLRCLVLRGDIPSQRAGRKYLVAIEDVIQYIDSKEVVS
ncbi:hypothetical protein [Allofournierella massiliensis]|uniref:hypothetical protein n=1 Tax=Allofournierella massiliensis TaxID=1650663 RepID=UPI0039A2CF63